MFTEITALQKEIAHVAKNPEKFGYNPYAVLAEIEDGGEFEELPEVEELNFH